MLFLGFERKESIYPLITRYGIFGKCSVSLICHSSDCSWVRQLDTDAVGDEDIHTRYEDDLPDSIGFIAEMERWKMFCAGLQNQDSNQSLEEAIVEYIITTSKQSCQKCNGPRRRFLASSNFLMIFSMNEQTSQSSKSIFCHCRSAPVFQAAHSRKRPLTGHKAYLQNM
jgi:hypothetical protein